MNHQTQNTLTILLSSIFFGLAGFWLIPGRAEGAIVGAAAGATAASGHVQQDKRLRHLASQQKQLSVHYQEANNPTYQEQVNNLIQLVTQAKQTIESVAHSTAEHEAKISELEGILRPNSGQARLNQNEINRIRTRLEDLAARIEGDFLTDKNDRSQLTKHIELRLSELESRINPVLSNHANIDHKATIVSDFAITLEQEDTIGSEAAQTVIEWLKNKQIEVENYYEPDPKIDDLLDGLSLYLGDNYPILNKFHWRLRQSVGRSLHFDLKDYDSRQKSIHNQFLKRLKSCDYLSRGRIIKNQGESDFIIAASHSRPDIQGFFDGGWFERFIYYKVVELFDSEGVDYQYLRNPKIVYSSEGNSELDLFFLVNGKPLLIECKAGQNYDEGIAKFVQHQQNLGLDSNNAIFVVLDIGEAEAHLRTKNWNITVADQNNFIDRIRDLITIKDHSSSQVSVATDDQEESNEIVAPATTNDNSLESFFRKQGLNLAPEHRSVILAELIQLVTQMDNPTNLTDITKTIRDKMREGTAVGRNKIAEILNCVRYSDLFRDERNKPVRNVSKLISSMASTRPKTLEKKCIEFYAEKVLQLFDPDFFDIEENVQEFERLTLGNLPDKFK